MDWLHTGLHQPQTPRPDQPATFINTALRRPDAYQGVHPRQLINISPESHSRLRRVHDRHRRDPLPVMLAPPQ